MNTKQVQYKSTQIYLYNAFIQYGLFQSGFKLIKRTKTALMLNKFNFRCNAALKRIFI